MTTSPITVYWAPITGVETQYGEWNLLFSNPNSLSLTLAEKAKQPISPESMYLCPAFKSKAKNTYVFTFPMTCSYEYNFTETATSAEGDVFPTDNTKPFLNAFTKKASSLQNTGYIHLPLNYIFFSTESLLATFTPPYYGKAKYTKTASMPIGTFDIGQWLRPLPAELTVWDLKGTLNFEENEPFFYIEFLTNRPIILKRVKPTTTLLSYATMSANSGAYIWKNMPLIKRYKKFKETSMRSLILKEIEGNILD